MDKIYMVFLVLILLVSFVYAKQVILFNFEYDNGEISLENVNVIEGYVSEIHDGDYSFHLLSGNDIILEKIDFRMPNVLEVAPTEEFQGKHIELMNFNFTIPASYGGRVDKIRIEKDNVILFEEDVTRYDLGKGVNWWFWVVIILLIIVGYLIYRINKT